MRFITFLLALLFPLMTFAQNAETISDTGATTASGQVLTPDMPLCSDVISISWPTQVKANTAHDFGITDNNGTVVPFGSMQITSDTRSEELVLEGTRLTYSFPVWGIVKMIFTPTTETTYHCRGSIEKTVHVFREMIVYIGHERPDISDQSLLGIFREKSVLLEPIFVKNSFKIEDQSALWTTLGTADIVVLNYDNLTELFADMESLQRLKVNNFTNTKFFIISPYSRTFLAKVLASSVAKLGITNISLISNDQLSTLLGKWSYEDDRDATLGEPLSYEKNHYALTMNSFLEYLAYAGVSYQFLGFLLLISIVALVFNILKQIVGWDTFSLYHPFLFAIIIAQMGYAFSLSFAIISMVSIYLVRLITTKIPLLVNAKKSFLISLYTLLSLAALGIDNLFEMGIFHYTIFQNSIAVITIFAILIIVDKFFDQKKIFSKSFSIKALQYVLLVGIAVLIFGWQDLRYFLISYPDTIFLIVLANLFIGRYTGLQVVEYIRFAPILKNLSEEE